jgi:two-component system, sensor histidine kinase PdtaS
MATLADLARRHADLTRDDILHLQRLTAEWGVLADFCFADLLLYVPTADGGWCVVDQVRPATSQTLYQADYVGGWANETERPLLARAYESGELVEGDIVVEGLVEPTRMLAIPVRHNGRAIAVLTREWSPRTGRQAGELERTYLAAFRRFAAMIAAGDFPLANTRSATISAAPRVGDGVLVLDAEARVEYASPNAVSALRRVGISANVLGLRLAELGFEDSPVRQALERREPVMEEFDQTADITLLVRCLPMLATGEVTGAVLMMRDVSELRQRDRLLLSKDATIREIHHRVKNNLQTISSLLRLQARRIGSDEARAVINESVRRIRTIALVHETLSREAADDVPFVEIVRPLLRLAEDGLQSPERPVHFRVEGDGGKLPAAIATPLAIVLTELLQNAIAHAFPDRDGERPDHVVVLLDHDDAELVVRVVDDGVGVPGEFSPSDAQSLGLTIVRTLVTTELGGSLVLGPATAEDHARARLRPVPPDTGTTVVIRVPIGP